MRRWIVAALGLAGCVHFPKYPDASTVAPHVAPSLLIHDVTVFTAGEPRWLEHTDVALEDGKIAAMGPTGTVTSAGAVIEGRGRTLMPGLVDLHVHMALVGAPPWYLTVPQPSRNAQDMLVAGVTALLDLGGRTVTSQRLIAAEADGSYLGPRIYYAGPGLTVKDGYPLNMAKELYGQLAYMTTNGKDFVALADVPDIEREVDALADAGATFVKLMVVGVPPGDPPPPRLSEAMVVAATARAHARGLKVAAHIDSAEDARICARAGVDLLAHGVETDRLTDEDLATLKASGISFEPTLVGWQRGDDLFAKQFHPTRLELLTQPPAIVRSLDGDRIAAHADAFQKSRFVGWSDAITAHRADRIENARRMFEAGIPLRVGSDAQGTIATFPGSIHSELALLVDAGIPLDDVLFAATAGNARFVDPRATFGEVRPGLDADLLLIAGDPRVDVHDTEHVVEVFRAGMPVWANLRNPALRAAAAP